MARPKDDAPQTRRAHPTQVRSALVEAELKAKMKAEAAAVRATGPATGPSVIVAQSGIRPRAGAPSREGGRSTAPRVRAVTPRPPEPPQLYLEPLVAAAPEAPPALVVDAQPEPQPVAEAAARPRQIWMVAAAVAACGVLAVIILL
ncbi:MAG: hypothetical protein U1F43_31700 [Myxococcota bacterium]